MSARDDYPYLAIAAAPPAGADSPNALEADCAAALDEIDELRDKLEAAIRQIWG